MSEPQQQREVAMEQEQVDPNLNAEAYRNLPQKQVVQDKQLQFVLVYKDESLVLGASNMVDRYWYGTLWFFSEPVRFDRSHYTAALRTESGACAAAYLGKHDKFVVGEDSGLLQIFEISVRSDTKAKELQCQGYSCQHDSGLTSVSTFDDNTHVVTAGMDCCIKVWDTSEMIATSSFNQAHTDTVSDVEVQVGSNAVFSSVSLDSQALIWDIRKLKPALGLWNKPHCPLTTVSWKPNDVNIVAVGGLDGSILILDMRYPGRAPLYESNQFDRGVHKLLFNPNNPTQLAGCCDSTEVKVFDTSDLSDICNIYKSSEHSDFVRGLAWHKSDLITCAWDNTVLRHSVTSKLCA